MDDHKAEPTGQALREQVDELRRKLEELQAAAPTEPLRDPPRKLLDAERDPWPSPEMTEEMRRQLASAQSAANLEGLREMEERLHGDPATMTVGQETRRLARDDKGQLMAREVIHQPPTLREYVERLPEDHPVREEFLAFRAMLRDLRDDVAVLTRVRDKLLKQLDDLRAERDSREGVLKGRVAAREGQLRRVREWVARHRDLKQERYSSLEELDMLGEIAAVLHPAEPVLADPPAEVELEVPWQMCRAGPGEDYERPELRREVNVRAVGSDWKSSTKAYGVGGDFVWVRVPVRGTGGGR